MSAINLNRITVVAVTVWLFILVYIANTLVKQNELVKSVTPATGVDERSADLIETLRNEVERLKRHNDLLTRMVQKKDKVLVKSREVQKVHETRKPLETDGPPSQHDLEL